MLLFAGPMGAMGAMRAWGRIVRRQNVREIQRTLKEKECGGIAGNVRVGNIDKPCRPGGAENC